MLTTATVSLIFSTSMMALVAVDAAGQTYPSKPIRIVTASPGGGSDFSARVIAQGIATPLGQPIVVENRPSGTIPGLEVAKATADGYTLLLGSTSLWVGPLLRPSPYDAVRDFVPISTASWSPVILVVTPSLPVKSIKELIALAKARPGDLNYGTVSAGSTNHLAAELLKSMARVNIVHVAYKSTATVQADVIGGYVQLSFFSGGPVMAHVKSGRLRALAVTSAQPSAVFPGVPTVAATGLPGYEMIGIDGIFAPARTPAAIVNRLSQEIVRYLSTPEAKEKFLTGAGGEALGSSSEEFAAKIKSEIAKIGKVIKDAGIRLEE